MDSQTIKQNIAKRSRQVLISWLQEMQNRNDLRVLRVWNDELGQKIRRISVDYMVGYRGLY